MYKDVKAFILCSPHNPVGRVWRKEELKEMLEICHRHHVYVISDEIHQDFVFGNKKQTPSYLMTEHWDEILTITAPSKTFNLAGLNTSNIIIADDDLRRRFRKTVTDIGASAINVMGLTACRAAYESGLPWLQEVRNYIRGNMDFTASYLAENIPEVRLIRPEGTYLLWLDMRGLGLGDEELERFITQDAGLWLDRGSMFGPEGAGFQRINTACPRPVMEQALRQLHEAVLSIRR